MAHINESQVERVAQAMRDLLDAGRGLNFYSFHVGGKEIIADDMYPRINHPAAIDFFFFVCLHQYGFWEGDERGYVRPLTGVLGGNTAKGSELIWKSAMLALRRNPDIFSPSRLAEIDSFTRFSEIFHDDHGPIPFADPDTRVTITQRYATWFLWQNISPSKFVKEANEEDEPLRRFRAWLWEVAGYDKDPLEKKNLLLAMALAERPERFLWVTDPYNWSPIIDYHLMRLSLRLGIVELSADQVEQNKSRAWVDANSECDIREAVYTAVESIINKSGRSMSFIDQTMWMARKYCPEMSVPNCGDCIFNTVCAHRIELFQPVFRTTAY